ncbi:MAG TPA: YbhB/YbcL family Raf kinase inhibitor-like protein [Methanobacterium sp.]|nr:YbhB/YbcL family Raf kinase inhibitor-like protein [Methanobacterium sp.]
MTIKITSPVFNEGEPIPARYSCNNVNVSPPLEFKDIPENTVSIAVILEDPDAPGGLFTHWIIFNLPADTNGLSEHIMPRELMDDGSKHGMNSFGLVGYGGPCPPSGTHRYFFRVYALDVKLDLPPLVEREELLRAFEGHILDQGELMGVFTR